MTTAKQIRKQQKATLDERDKAFKANIDDFFEECIQKVGTYNRIPIPFGTTYPFPTSKNRVLDGRISKTVMNSLARKLRGLGYSVKKQEHCSFYEVCW